MQTHCSESVWQTATETQYAWTHWTSHAFVCRNIEHCSDTKHPQCGEQRKSIQTRIVRVKMPSFAWKTMFSWEHCRSTPFLKYSLSATVLGWHSQGNGEHSISQTQSNQRKHMENRPQNLQHSDVSRLLLQYLCRQAPSCRHATSVKPGEVGWIAFFIASLHLHLTIALEVQGNTHNFGRHQNFGVSVENKSVFRATEPVSNAAAVCCPTADEFIPRTACGHSGGTGMLRFASEWCAPAQQPFSTNLHRWGQTQSGTRTKKLVWPCVDQLFSSSRSLPKFAATRPRNFSQIYSRGQQGKRQTIGAMLLTATIQLLKSSWNELKQHKQPMQWHQTTHNGTKYCWTVLHHDMPQRIWTADKNAAMLSVSNFWIRTRNSWSIDKVWSGGHLKVDLRFQRVVFTKLCRTAILQTFTLTKSLAKSSPEWFSSSSSGCQVEGTLRMSWLQKRNNHLKATVLMKATNCSVARSSADRRSPDLREGHLDEAWVLTQLPVLAWVLVRVARLVLVFPAAETWTTSMTAVATSRKKQLPWPSARATFLVRTTASYRQTGAAFWTNWSCGGFTYMNHLGL